MFANFRTVMLPYCLQKRGDGFVVLNRDYKPLGCFGKRVDYDEIGITVDMTPAMAKRIGLLGDGVAYYTYDDGSIPSSSAENWDRYQKILAALLKLDVKVAEGVAPAGR